MTPVFVAAIIFGGIVLIIGTICGTVLMAMKIRHGGVFRKNRKELDEETRMIQEIYQAMGDMERRVENLETILMDYGRKEGKQ